MRPIIAGYVEQKELRNVTEADASKLDIINVAFAYCKNSKVFLKNTEDFENLSHIRKFNPNIKILFSVGGWGAGGFSPMAATAENRESFALSCLECVKKYSLDGIDIDWEYPSLDWAGIESSPDDKHNFTLMLQKVREVFDTQEKHLMLTIAVGCDKYYTDNTEMDEVAKVLDYVSIMTYDMRGCGEPITGHHTNVYSYESKIPERGIRSVDHSVKVYTEAGVPKEKIVIGGAFYSRKWTGVKSTEDVLGSKADPGDYGPAYGTIITELIGKNGFEYYYDDVAKAPYIFNGDTFISFDDARSLGEKIDYISANGLYGIMYWEHSCDPTRTLITAISNKVKTLQ